VWTSEDMIKWSSQNENFNLSALYVDITEALEHHETTYCFYVSTELIVIFEPLKNIRAS
jgi:hypothetical protein